MRTEHFACLDSGNQLATHRGREKETKSMFKEEKKAKTDRNSPSKIFVMVSDHDIVIHAKIWHQILNSKGDLREYRAKSMLYRDKRPLRELGVKLQGIVSRHMQKL